MALDQWFERTAASLLGGNLPEVFVAVAVWALLMAFALSTVATLGAAFFKGEM